MRSATLRNRVVLVAALGVAVTASARPASLEAAPPRQPVTEKRPLPLPDLRIHSVTFEQVSTLTAADGTPCQLFNLTVDIANDGSATAGSFSVTIYRKFPGARWTVACQTCTMDVPSLKPGYHYLFPARQFNNCSTGTADFRVIVDSKRQVKETDETNNVKEASFVPPS